MEQLISYKGKQITYEQLEKIINDNFVDDIVDELIANNKTNKEASNG